MHEAEFSRSFGGLPKIFWMSFQNILDVFQSWKNYLELLQKTTSTTGLISLMIFIVSIFYSYQSTALILRSHCVGGCPKFLLPRFDNICTSFFQVFPNISKSYWHNYWQNVYPHPALCCIQVKQIWCFGSFENKKNGPW